ncbi:MAG: cytochrome c biogenesis protein [Gallionella sp.]|nr:cytochrome c biogenesis protein [Gallionella sp.]
MSFIETFFLAAAAALYVASFVLAIKCQERYAYFSLVAGLVFQLLSAAIRWVGIGHPPVFGTYEATLSASWFLLLFVALSFRSVHRNFRLLVLVSVPLALLLLWYGLTLFRTERIPLTISEMSLWVDFHALFAWLAFAPFTLAFCLSAHYLWSTRNGSFSPSVLYPGTTESPRAAEFKGKKAESENPNLQPYIVDELAFRYVNFGFVMHTVMFALGSYYSSIIFGIWWWWDPVFSLSLIAWLSVGLYIHMRLFFNWHGRKAAWLFVAVFSAIILSYWGLVYLPPGSTFHVFDVFDTVPKMF